METESNMNSLCDQFAKILKGKGTVKDGVCSVSLKRSFKVKIMDKDAPAVLGVEVNFQSLDSEGNALMAVETPVLQEEVPAYTDAALSQGIIVSAIHNHWLYSDPPQLMYTHFQSVEPPLEFAKKLAFAFTKLKSAPIQD